MIGQSQLAPPIYLDPTEWRDMDDAPKDRPIWAYCLFWGEGSYHWETELAPPGWYRCGSFCQARAEPIAWRERWGWGDDG